MDGVNEEYYYHIQTHFYCSLHLVSMLFEYQGVPWKKNQSINWDEDRT